MRAIKEGPGPTGGRVEQEPFHLNARKDLIALGRLCPSARLMDMAEHVDVEPALLEHFIETWIANM